MCSSPSAQDPTPPIIPPTFDAAILFGSRPVDKRQKSGTSSTFLTSGGARGRVTDNKLNQKRASATVSI